MSNDSNEPADAPLDEVGGTDNPETQQETPPPGTDSSDQEPDQDAEPTTTAPPGHSPTDQPVIDDARAAEND